MFYVPVFGLTTLWPAQLKQLGPRSDFAFLGAIPSLHQHLISRWRGRSLKLFSQTGCLLRNAFGKTASIVSHQTLKDILNQPVAELYVVRSYASQLQSLSNLGAAWHWPGF